MSLILNDKIVNTKQCLYKDGKIIITGNFNYNETFELLYDS